MKRLTLLVTALSLFNLPVHAAEKRITLLSTNDIHGGVEPTPDKSGQLSGGMALLSGAVKAIREAATREDAGVLVVDAGDQFQGTLISNYDEGQLVFATMQAVGYDAVVPGNHDYDFGPIGWLVDQSDRPELRREALERLAGQVDFPLVAANTYLKSSLGVAVDGNRCKPTRPGAKIDWGKARRPDIFKPWVVREVAGVRVALIGLDNPETPKITTLANVSDLCFADELESYARARKELEGKADVFILVVHDGDSNNEHKMKGLVQKLTSMRGGGVDAVISGHTHFTYNEKVNGVPLTQSGSGGARFGRIDLFWDTRTKRIVKKKTRSYGGVKLLATSCDTAAKDFCKAEGGKVRYDGVPLVSDAKVTSLIKQAREAIEPLAGRKLGHADRELDHDRIAESSLADAVTDVFRAATGADVAFVNTGGLRDRIPAGDFTYETLFKVFPFNNHGVVVGPMTTDQLLALLQRSIETCGTYGALMQSGLKVTYQRHCDTRSGGVDHKARLLRVETTAGEVIHDGGWEGGKNRVFQVATLDFLASGGSGYEGFKGIPLVRDDGILREKLTTEFLAHPVHWSGQVDGRWRQLNPE